VRRGHVPRLDAFLKNSLSKAGTRPCCGPVGAGLTGRWRGIAVYPPTATPYPGRHRRIPVVGLGAPGLRGEPPTRVTGGRTRVPVMPHPGGLDGTRAFRGRIPSFRKSAPAMEGVAATRDWKTMRGRERGRRPRLLLGGRPV